MTPETDAVWKGNDIVKQVMTSRRLERERDEARTELAGCQAKNKRISAELLVKLQDTERERDEAREIIRKAKVKFCEDGPDGKIAAEMFAILGSLEREYK